MMQRDSPLAQRLLGDVCVRVCIFKGSFGSGLAR
jgi:hypothetical protein